MKDRNISRLKLPKAPEPVILSGPDDPSLPLQIAKDLRSRDDVVEIVYFAPFRHWRGQYRATFITSITSGTFNMCRFYV